MTSGPRILRLAGDARLFPPNVNPIEVLDADGVTVLYSVDPDGNLSRLGSLPEVNGDRIAFDGALQKWVPVPDINGWGFSHWHYNFADQGGAIGTITLPSDVPLPTSKVLYPMPAGALLNIMVVRVIQALDDGGSGMATVSLNLAAPGDLVASKFDTPGDSLVIPAAFAAASLVGTVLNPQVPFLLAAPAVPSFTIAGHALTAGEFVFGAWWLNAGP